MPHILFEEPLELEVNLGKEPEPKKLSWTEIDDILKKASEDGFIVRSIVVEKSLGEYQKPDPLNWGVITRIDRYQSREPFKPLVCVFFKSKSTSSTESFSPDELAVVYHGKSWEELRSELNKRS